jgi:LuxR family transcriptional regulator, maltose regulon positive regulatory protein
LSRTLSSVPLLVTTKLQVPELRPGLVPRSELVARLVDGAGRRLSLVCAPAGWGKSILLGEWHAAGEETRPFAWVSLDAGDDDPVRFWSYVIAALRTVEPEIGRDSLAALPAAGSVLVDVVLPPLLNELAALPRPLVLVLDDYHLVHDRLIHESVAYFLLHLPRPVQLAVASRADPPLPLGRMRAAGDVTEVRAAELRFSDVEAEALLNGSFALGLAPEQVALLVERTEGWPAGLQLAALSVRGQDDRGAAVRVFAGDDRHIGDYLHEILDTLSEPVQEFLLRTSILEAMCPSLCDAVCGGAEALARLKEIDRANLFLVTLDRRWNWYRYHHLFRDLLRQELARAQPELVPELHRRASAWHRAHGDVGEAITHATAAGEFTDAAELIARHWGPTIGRGQRETVAGWIDALPREVVLADPRLCLARGWTSLFLRRPDEVEPWLRAAEAGTLPGPLLDGGASVEANAALLRSRHATFAGDVGVSVEQARLMLALEPVESPTHALSRLSLAIPLYFAGELDAAADLVEEAPRPLPGPDWADAVVCFLGFLGVIRADTGQLERAEHALDELDRYVEQHRLDELPVMTLGHIARGKLREQRGDTAAARAAFARALVLARRGASRLDLAHALLLLSRLERRRDHVVARSLAREAREVLAPCPDPGILGELLATTERALQLTASREAAGGGPVVLELSERELAVLRLLASDLSQREIGAELYVSYNTVKAHTRSIFRKLGVSTRAEAVARGHDLGL